MFDRADLTKTPAEVFRPIPIALRANFPGILLDRLRLFADLQYASVTYDVEVFARKTTGRLLDVGCGAQPFRRFFGTSEYLGLDIADSDSKFSYRSPDTVYYDGGVFPFGDKEFSRVLCTETLEHVPEPRVFLSEIFRVMDDKAVLLLTVPFAARWHFVPFDYWRFTPSGLSRLFCEAGFSSIAVHARGDEVVVAAYKCVSIAVSLLTSTRSSLIGRMTARLVGLFLAPFAALALLIAHTRLRSKSPNFDCLGYTVVARRQKD